MVDTRNQWKRRLRTVELELETARIRGDTEAERTCWLAARDLRRRIARMDRLLENSRGGKKRDG